MCLLLTSGVTDALFSLRCVCQLAWNSSSTLTSACWTSPSRSSLLAQAWLVLLSRGVLSEWWRLSRTQHQSFSHRYGRGGLSFLRTSTSIAGMRACKHERVKDDCNSPPIVTDTCFKQGCVFVSDLFQFNTVLDTLYSSSFHSSVSLESK